MGCACVGCPGTLSELDQPHIGETITKTNAIHPPDRRLPPPGTGRRQAFEGGF